MTYDVLGNERHKAVCGLRKLSDSPSDIWVWKRQLGEAIGADNEMYSSINERLIHLLRGGVEPTTLRELFGILKEGDDGVDTGGRDETGGDRSDAAADGHMADCAGSQVFEGVAPITAELRELLADVSWVEITDHMRLDHGAVLDDDWLDSWHAAVGHACDAIDAVHAQLERDYKMACEVNGRQDEQYADMVHKLDRAYEKNRNQRKQLTEVQEALHRRNEGELKRRWMREKQDLELQIAKMRLESVELPKDADGEYIREHDKVDWRDHAGTWHENATVVAVCNDGCYVMDGTVFHVHKSDIRHHHAPTVEDVLREFFEEVGDGLHTLKAVDTQVIIAKYAAKLRLAEVEDA